jgi:hypothetical protein
VAITFWQSLILALHFPGVKLLDGETTDLIESKALQFGLDKVDIYSGSWGPPDDGKSMDGPGKLSKAAIDRGIREVRRTISIPQTYWYILT